MTLVRCQVCGSETSDREEICIICGHPWKGRSRDFFWKGIALLIAVIFLFILLFNLF